MSKINVGRVVAGGIVAGIIIDIFEDVLNGIVLSSHWASIMQSMNLSMPGMHAIVAFNIDGLILGLGAVWTYAAIRPRFGAGLMTSVYAALLVWVVGYALPNLTNHFLGFVPMHITLVVTVVGLIEIIAATVAGAFFYQET